MPKRQLNLKLPLGFLHPDLYANSTSKSEWVMVLQEQGKTICVALENIYKDIKYSTTSLESDDDFLLFGICITEATTAVVKGQTPQDPQDLLEITVSNAAVSSRACGRAYYSYIVGH